MKQHEILAQALDKIHQSFKTAKVKYYYCKPCDYEQWQEPHEDHTCPRCAAQMLTSDK